MSRLFSTLLTVLIVLCGIVASAQDPVPLQSIGDRDGNMYEYSVASERFQAIPTWDPSKTDPPLATVKATAAALQWLVGKHQLDPNKLTLGGIKFVRVPRHDLAGHWFCEVEFVEGWGDIARHRSWSVVLLMDGSVVEPTLRKAPQRAG